MSQSMHGMKTMHLVHTPRKHIVPTHLNVPDQVLTLWSFSLTARQLLLLLVGGGIGGTIWQHLALFGHFAVPGEILRLLLSLPLFLLALYIAWYQHAGRYLYGHDLYPLVQGGDDRDMEERASQNTRDTQFGRRRDEACTRTARCPARHGAPA
jgi:hypothetical protein